MRESLRDHTRVWWVWWVWWVELVGSHSSSRSYLLCTVRLWILNILQILHNVNVYILNQTYSHIYRANYSSDVLIWLCTETVMEAKTTLEKYIATSKPLNKMLILISLICMKQWGDEVGVVLKVYGDRCWLYNLSKITKYYCVYRVGDLILEQHFIFRHQNIFIISINDKWHQSTYYILAN